MEVDIGIIPKIGNSVSSATSFWPKSSDRHGSAFFPYGYFPNKDRRVDKEALIEDLLFTLKLRMRPKRDCLYPLRRQTGYLPTR